MAQPYQLQIEFTHFRSWIEFFDSKDYDILSPESKGALNIIAETSGNQAALLLINTCIDIYGRPKPLEDKLVTSE
jgi:hypothetical protein